MKVVTNLSPSKQTQFKQVPLNIGRPLSQDDEDPQVEAYRRKLLLQNNKQLFSTGIQQTNKLNGIQKLQNTTQQYGQQNSEINEQSQNEKIIQNNINQQLENQVKMNYRVKNITKDKQQHKMQQSQNIKNLYSSESSQNLKNISNRNSNNIQLTQAETLLQNGNNLVKTLQHQNIYENHNPSHNNSGSMNDNLSNLQLKQGVKMVGAQGSGQSQQILNGSTSNSGAIRYSRKEYLQNFANRNILVARQENQPQINKVLNPNLQLQIIQEDKQSEPTPKQLNNNIIKDQPSDLSNVYQTEYTNKSFLSQTRFQQQQRDKINMQSQNVSNALNLLIIEEKPYSQNQGVRNISNMFTSNTNQQQYGMKSPTSNDKNISFIPQIPLRKYSIKTSASRGNIISSSNNSRFDDQNKNLLIQGNYQTYQQQSQPNQQTRKYSVNNLQRQSTNSSNKILSIKKAR